MSVAAGVCGCGWSCVAVHVRGKDMLAFVCANQRAGLRAIGVYECKEVLVAPRIRESELSFRKIIKLLIFVKIRLETARVVAKGERGKEENIVKEREREIGDDRAARGVDAGASFPAPVRTAGAGAPDSGNPEFAAERQKYVRDNGGIEGHVREPDPEHEQHPGEDLADPAGIAAHAE